jgi:hypothetical protein
MQDQMANPPYQLEDAFVARPSADGSQPLGPDTVKERPAVEAPWPGMEW